MPNRPFGATHAAAALHASPLPIDGASLSLFACPTSLIDVESYRIRAINAAARAAGLLLRETCYTCVHGRAHPCTHSGQPCPIEEAVQRGVPIQIQHEHLTAGGQRRRQNVLVLPLLNCVGAVAQVLHCRWDAPPEHLAPHRRARLGAGPGRDLTARQLMLLLWGQIIGVVKVLHIRERHFTDAYGIDRRVLFDRFVDMIERALAN